MRYFFIFGAVLDSLLLEWGVGGSVAVPSSLAGAMAALPTMAIGVLGMVTATGIGRLGIGHNHNHHFHNRRFFANNVFIGGYPYYDDYYYGYRGCCWLRRQAVITGSPYWWNRYQACYGYY